MFYDKAHSPLAFDTCQSQSQEESAHMRSEEESTHIRRIVVGRDESWCIMELEYVDGCIRACAYLCIKCRVSGE